MQLFRVTDAKGNLVMIAPLENIQAIFDLEVTQLDLIRIKTRDLDAQAQIHLWPAAFWRWRELIIQRLPEEIPAEAPKRSLFRTWVDLMTG